MYLSKIVIENYKGIEHLEVSFSPDINIIIGENGCCKSALIDAIRLLYNLGEPIKEITVNKEDFFEKIIMRGDTPALYSSELIKIAYEFKGLTPMQKGAFYEYMVVDPTNPENDYAQIELQYKKGKYYPVFSYNTGNIEGQKADSNTFHLFQHYYLSALRDSTRDLLSTRNNLLGKVIKRLVERNDSEEEIKGIINEANTRLLERDEVTSTRENINRNLNAIYKNINRGLISLQIEQSRIEYIVNVIKPFLPHNLGGGSSEGFNLRQNSLGFNNLIYIATVLGDIKERVKDDAVPHFALLIEEPEAHIHPQLQLNLYNFLKEANKEAKSQLFITSHSPTLTSRVPLDNLILLNGRGYTVGKLFENRLEENIIQDTTNNKPLSEELIKEKKDQLERYIDVTKSQLFFSRSCLFVEGISEELLISAFSRVEGFALEDYGIELVNVDGTSFYPFMFLFNSVTDEKRLPKKIAILTDDDRFPLSKRTEYSLDRLTENDYNELNVLHSNLRNGLAGKRINNLNSVKNRRSSINIQTAYQTMEYDICRSNMQDTKTKCKENFLFKFIKDLCPDKIEKVEKYMHTLEENLNEDQQDKVAILLWKSLPPKAEFAQKLALNLIEEIKKGPVYFSIPNYIKEAFIHLTH